MSYYAVDLLSSLPSGSSGGGSTVETPQETAPSRPEPVEEVPPEAIRTVDKKPKKKPLPKPVPKPAAKTPAKVPSWATADSLPTAEESPKPSAGGANRFGSGSSPAVTGTPFPYPWYLKTVSDKLESQWKPPPEFRNDTKCQVLFIIHADGKVTGAKVTKDSGDAFFDQLALRAVLYAGNMPPLPTGFREPELRVYMTFEGKK